MGVGKVVICCWSKGHLNEFVMNKRAEEALNKRAKKMTAVCPNCRALGFGNQAIFIYEGQMLINKPKAYQCRHHHISTITPFAHGMINLTFGFEFENFDITLEELEKSLDSGSIVCHHNDQGKMCGGMLKPIDDYQLSYPQGNNIKTKTRVGDVWDKNHLHPVTRGHYDNDGHYHATSTEQASKERIARMRRRNGPRIPMPGERLNRPTNRQYERRSKDSIDFNE